MQAVRQRQLASGVTTGHDTLAHACSRSTALKRIRDDKLPLITIAAYLAGAEQPGALPQTTRLQAGSVMPKDVFSPCS